ncbi:MAG TPA: energy transducer TonB [Edaphobacter sp.]
MADLSWNPDEQLAGENLRGNFFGSLVLHAVVAATIAGLAYFQHRGQSWGENISTAGAIQATAVASIPLPPKQRELDTGVLTSEAPSPAPVTTKQQTIEAPKPDEIPIPEKKVKPVKQAPEPMPAPPKHPQPAPPQPTKATTGETAGIRIPQSSLQLKNGTASAMVQDRTFGSRFAYYVNIVNRTVAQNWYTQEADPRASLGKSAVVIFDIDRSGAPSNPRIATSSGSPSLDQSALRAVQRVEGFGPLPAGDHITVEYTFHYTQP